MTAGSRGEEMPCETFRRPLAEPQRPSERAEMAISPDGKWVLLGPTNESASGPLQLQPVGSGQPRDLTPGLVAFDNLEWSDDGKQIAYEAQTGQGDWNVYTQLVASGGPILLRMRGRKGLSCALARWKDRGVV